MIIYSLFNIQKMGEQQQDNGCYTKESFINKLKPVCILCEGKHQLVLCEVFLIYECRCFGCDSHIEYICKKCSLNTELFTHLCNCFRQSSRHGWYNLKEVWKKTGL